MMIPTHSRRKTRPVKVGGVTIGGDAPISVQSMTKTHTVNVDETVTQIDELAGRGCEIIRCAVPNRKTIPSLTEVVQQSVLPLIADIHFDPGIALQAMDAGVDGIRLNPPTMSDQDVLHEVYEMAGERDLKVRIGINSGSVRARTGLEVSESDEGEDTSSIMVGEALRCCKEAEKAGCANLVISLKASSVPETLRAYRLAASRCDYPFHVGVTAAGPPESSLVKSAVGIGALLSEGIGDTIRVSMTGSPHREVDAAYDILRALELRAKTGPEIVSCPTCGRCEIDIEGLVREIEQRLEGVEKPLRVAVMGCVVNGPGEAAEADVGVAGGSNFGYLFKNGRKTDKVPASKLADALVATVEEMCSDDEIKSDK